MRESEAGSATHCRSCVSFSNFPRCLDAKLSCYASTLQVGQGRPHDELQLRRLAACSSVQQLCCSLLIRALLEVFRASWPDYQQCAAVGVCRKRRVPRVELTKCPSQDFLAHMATHQVGKGGEAGISKLDAFLNKHHAAVAISGPTPRPSCQKC